MKFPLGKDIVLRSGDDDDDQDSNGPLMYTRYYIFDLKVKQSSYCYKQY